MNITALSKTGIATQNLTYTSNGQQSIVNGANAFRSYGYDNNGNATSDGQRI